MDRGYLLCARFLSGVEVSHGVFLVIFLVKSGQPTGELFGCLFFSVFFLFRQRYRMTSHTLLWDTYITRCCFARMVRTNFMGGGGRLTARVLPAVGIIMYWPQQPSRNPQVVVQYDRLILRCWVIATRSFC